MCGILGIASATQPPASPELIATMRDALRHRGPDANGTWTSQDQHITLAHTRLAVIDLSASANQPMHSVCGQTTIAYNGEIYNYRELRRELDDYDFRSESDTEVLLAAYRRWGTSFVEHLNGMFALAIYDHDKRELLLARDRAGQKPLFYRHDGRGGLRFASELKALLRDPDAPRALDLQALDCYLAYGYVQGGDCLLAGYRKLRPGHILRYQLDRDDLTTHQYWDLPQRGTTKETAAPLRQEIEEILADSIKKRLVADVPVGILLSGGVDSSLIAALAVRDAQTSVRTFTIVFPESPQLDEGPHARAVANFLGTEHTELEVRPTTAAILETLAEQYDEPIADYSIIPTSFVCELVRQHATVALGGDGGDELFGGYGHYNFVQSLDVARKIIPGPLRTVLGRLAGTRLEPGTRGRNHLLGLAGDLASSIAHINLFFDATTRSQLVRGIPMGAESIRERLSADGTTPLQKATRADFRTTMVDGYLVKIDRASMLHSLELRCPFLDHRLVELAFRRLPDEQRATHRRRKIILKDIAQKWLPPGFDLQRKQGFTPPLASWFRGDWGDFMRAQLRNLDGDLFDHKVINALVDGQDRGRANIARLFALTMFSLWQKRYGITLPTGGA